MSRVPGILPGFRFYPTDQELVVHYLKKKVTGENVQALRTVIGDVDIYKFEPPELPGLATLRSRDLEWYFFHPLDSYLHGSRTSRCTRAGYWKLTGKHREIAVGSHVVGVKKSLVYYGGRAPNGQRTNWVMHEYSLHPEFEKRINVLNFYVLCRVYKKQGLGPRATEKHGAPVMEDEVFRDCSQGCVESAINSGCSKDESQSHKYVIKMEDLNSEEKFQSFLESLTSLENNPNKQISDFEDNGIEDVMTSETRPLDSLENAIMEDLHNFLHPVPDEADILREMLEFGAETHLDKGFLLPTFGDALTCTGFLSNDNHLQSNHINVPADQHKAQLNAGVYHIYNTTEMQNYCNLNQHCAAISPIQLSTHLEVADMNGSSGSMQFCPDSSCSVGHREPLALEVRKH